MQEELSGLEIARLYFHEEVEPIIRSVMPALRYSAGLFGDGSDVMGLDDAVSRDHGWGPRCIVLLQAEGFDETRRALDAALAARLPLFFRGYTTSFQGRDGSAVIVDAPPVKHWVDMTTAEAFLRNYLGVTSAAGLTGRDWLGMRAFNLLGVTAGAMFRDDLGFDGTRRQFASYPDDVRRYLIAAEWMKIAEEQAIPGRAGSRGDEAGSAIVGARLAEFAMRIGFHLERRYAPYRKWFGSAFARLENCSRIHGAITRMLTASNWQERDRHWGDALAPLIALHEREGLLAAGKYRTAPVYATRPGTGLPQFERGGPPAIGALIDDIRGPIADREIRELARALGDAG
jgi:hypothetical protein